MSGLALMRIKGEERMGEIEKKIKFGTRSCKTMAAMQRVIGWDVAILPRSMNTQNSLELRPKL